jgi:hypothetical protein
VNFLPGLARSCDLPDLLPNSWDYRVSHHTQLNWYIFKANPNIIFSFFAVLGFELRAFT